MTVALLVLFFVVMIAIGVWGQRKTSTLGDFFLGGRSIGPWVSAFAYGTTYFSAVLFIGFAGKLGWGYGLKAIWIGVGNAVFGSLLAWFVLGRRTRRMTHNLGAMTMPEFFEARYGSTAMKGFAALVVFIFLLPYSASVYKGLSHLFEVTLNLDYATALLIMAAVTGVYLVLGGYFAVTLTDFIQGIIMLFGAIAMVIVLAGKAGGFASAVHQVATNYPLHVPAAKQPSLLLLGGLVFMTSFGTWGMPQMVQKFYSIEDERLIPKAAWATFGFATVIGLSAYFCGALTHVLMAAPTGKPNFDKLMPDMLNANLPPALMALILLLVLSASMSTLSSLVLVAASAVTIDVYKGILNPTMEDRKSLILIRCLSGLFVALSYGIATYQLSVIVTLMALSWGAVAGSFMAPFIYGLFWKRATPAAAWAGMVVGLATSVALFFVLGPDQSPLSASIAMVVPFAVVPVVSLCTAPTETSLIERAFDFSEPVEQPS